MKRILCLLLALTMVLGMVACGNNNNTSSEDDGTTADHTLPTQEIKEYDGEPQYGGALNIRWDSMGATLDPVATTGWGVYFWSNEVFENAICQDAEGKFQPAVCNFEISDDQMKLKLWVRDGVTFHDGTKVTIEDVLASMLRAGYNSNIKTWFWDYVDYYGIEDDVLTFEFSAYSSGTLYWISRAQTYCVIMPKRICDKYDINKDENAVIMTAEDCIGTGPYMVKEWRENEYVRCVRYDGYVPIETDATGMASTKHAYLDEIVMWKNSDDASTNVALMNGDYDMSRMDTEYEELLTAQGFYTWLDLASTLTYYCYNTKGDRPVNNVYLRKAIAAIMSNGVIHKIRKYYDVDYNPMGDGAYLTDAWDNCDWLGATSEDVIQEYLRLAKENGYNGEELIFLVSGASETMAVGCKEACAKYGIPIKLDYHDSQEVKAYYKNPANPFDMYYMTSAVCELTPNSLAPNLWQTFWKNDLKDQLFEDISQYAYGTTESLNLWNQIVEQWTNDCPTVIMAHTKSPWAVNGDLVLTDCAEGTQNYYWNAFWKNPEDHPSKFN